jgi:hypothetical protein
VHRDAAQVVANQLQRGLCQVRTVIFAVPLRDVQLLGVFLGAVRPGTPCLSKKEYRPL